ncbi:LacI family transcriptional regulator [Arthrobacter stackebrandtii]|uniref:LacI family transcriptional regulator n=1 Tax=Arthrobacter stackebrandtii TaxID=272161 RepID=A0ABS4YT77_9MICC|nr:LacI family DNA-binding transcriptional regulator [Arthrobacter stackebrandtii]MBP2412001.1 LacI family transcriptional regulator [Arthrobacter stackebrandtii]PYG99750.1 LacI family transcriptional regulator [Arthrobacter stackebrandtii]
MSLVTLKDIAIEVGVSISAVSLVLNGRGEGRVNAKVAARIQTVADDLGYVPNLLARGLKTKHSLTIGLLADGVASTSFAGSMVTGAQTAAAEFGYLLMLIDTVGMTGLETPAVKALLQRNIEGLIVAPDYHSHVKLPRVPRSMPIVVLDGRPAQGEADADWVVPDEVGGAATATRRLLQAGHRRIAMCNLDDERYIASSLRRQGYEEAIRDAGLVPDPSLHVTCAELSAEAARAMALELLQRADRPTAVFCFSDRLAFGVYQAAAQIGLSIPEDLSIVGFDNHPFVAESLLPGLTTIQLPHYAMGDWAARCLIRRSQHSQESIQPVSYLAACPLVERGSVAPPAA